jgi:hypothetical protein
MDWEHNSQLIARAPDVNYWLGASGARNVHTLHLACNPTRYFTLESQKRTDNSTRITVSPLFVLFILFAVGFKSLKMVTLHFPILSYMNCTHPLVHAEGIRFANEILHSKAKLLSVFPYWKPILVDSRLPRGLPREIGWLWMAEDGLVLDEVLLGPILEKLDTSDKLPLRDRILGYANRIRAHGPL